MNITPGVNPPQSPFFKGGGDYDTTYNTDLLIHSTHDSTHVPLVCQARFIVFNRIFWWQAVIYIALAIANLQNDVASSLA
jgi:hypothetical protein